MLLGDFWVFGLVTRIVTTITQVHVLKEGWFIQPQQDTETLHVTSLQGHYMA